MTTYLAKNACNKCGGHRRYRRSFRCVHCVAILRQNKVIEFSPKSALEDERVAMAGVSYPDEVGYLT